MPSTEQLRSRLLRKLSELFQLNQPELDFGFYRIMHAKSQEVQNFIQRDLLQIVKDVFGKVDETRRLELQTIYEEAIQTAKNYGSPHPEEVEPVKKAKAELDACKDSAGAEADVYDHLYRFLSVIMTTAILCHVVIIHVRRQAERRHLRYHIMARR